MSFTGFKLAEHCHRTNINSKNSTIIIIIIVITIIIIIIIIIIIMVCWAGDFLLRLQLGVQ